MKRQTGFTVAAAAVLGGTLGLTAQTAPRQLPQTSPPARAVAGVRTIATVKQVMHAIVIPASDALFKAAGDPPKDEAGWSAAQLQALAVAEGGNLLMIGNRPMDRAEWMAMSRAMVDAAGQAASAAEKKNGDALSAAGDKVYETCEACHTKYQKK
jgi:cytochrome c'